MSFYVVLQIQVNWKGWVVIAGRSTLPVNHQAHKYNYMFINIAQAGPMSTAPPLSSLVENVANFVTSLIAVIAILVIVVAGIMYMMSGGDTARVQVAKKALIGGITGLVIALLALTIVHTISNFV